MNRIRSSAIVVFTCFSLFPLASLGDGGVSEHFRQSLDYESSGDYSKALKEVMLVLRKSPDDYMANLRAGWLYYLLGKHTDSAIHYRRAVRMAPKAIEPLLGLSLPLVASKKWKEAEDVCKEALRLDSNNYTAKSRLAFTEFSIGKYAEAARLYKDILALYPGNLEMKLGLAWTYLRQGRSKAAKKLFKEVLRINPRNQSALSGLDAH
ncbi:MAG: tetratricopeptide repeat protein [Deltaproteobacteria bacterium]|nr:tetratricopeptide repeat protein [Deltaproteobacteria bacterium]